MPNETLPIPLTTQANHSPGPPPDEKLGEMLAVLGTLPATRIAVPAAALRACAELRPDAEILPHFAARALLPALPDIVLVHKGLLHELDHCVLANAIARLNVAAANDVYVLMARTAPPASAEAMGHVGALLAHARLRGTSSTRPEKGLAVIVSAHGCGNIGDDAVTVAAGEIARRAGMTHWRAVGPSPESAVLDAAELVIVGGGGIFYDVDFRGRPEVENIANYTAPLRYAREMGRASAILGVGTQSIATPLGKAAFAGALRDADLVSARDPVDVRVLQALNASQKVQLSADLAFALSALDPDPVVPVPLADRPLALIAFGAYTEARKSPGGRTLDDCIADAVRHLATDHEVLLTLHSEDDAAMYARIARQTGARVVRLADIGARATLALYRMARIVIASRFHGVVFGAMAGAAVVPVCKPDTKIGQLLRHGLPSLAAAETPSVDLAGIPADALVARARVAAPVEVARQVNAAMSNVALLAGVLEARRGG